MLRFRLVALCMSLILPLASLPVFAEPNVYVRSNGQFVGNGNEYKRGFWIPAVEDADEVFKSNPAALDEYHAHQEAAKWFGILNWGALGAYLTYAIISSSADRYNGGAGFVIFFVPWVTGLFFGASSNRHLLKAMNMANGVPSDKAWLTPDAEPVPARLVSQKSLALPIAAWSF